MLSRFTEPFCSSFKAVSPVHRRSLSCFPTYLTSSHTMTPFKSRQLQLLGLNHTFTRLISQRKADIKVKKTDKKPVAPTSDEVLSQLKNIQITPHHYSPAIQRDGENVVGENSIYYYIHKIFGAEVTPQSRAMVTALISLVYWVLTMLSIILICNIATDQGLFIPTYLSSRIPLEYSDGIKPEDIESLHKIIKDALVSKLMLNLEVKPRFGSPIVIKAFKQIKAELYNPKGYVKGYVIDLHCWPPKFQWTYKERESIIDLESLFQALATGVDSDSANTREFQIQEKPSDIYRKYTIEIKGSAALKRPKGSKLGKGFIEFKGSVDLEHTKYVKFDSISMVFQEDGHIKRIDLW